METDGLRPIASIRPVRRRVDPPWREPEKGQEKRDRHEPEQVEEGPLGGTIDEQV